jgi:hypothetical protein
MLNLSYFLLKELALFQIELYAGFSEALEHFLHFEQVLLECATNHDHVVQVHET